MPTMKFRVGDLEAADETRVERRVRGMEGVLFAVASHSARCLEVEFEDDCVTSEEIRAAVAALGLRVQVAG